jgi:hypothetical protein
MRWGEGIFKHYGATGYEPFAPMGYSYSGGYGGYFGNPMPSGPGREDPYKKLFDPKTIKTISGQVMKVDQTPQPGFGMEMRLIVFIGKKDILPVYLGPGLYVVGPGQAKRFKLGDKVTVSGSQVIVGGEPFMIATTVKRGNEVLRLRDKDGTPEWVGWKETND